MMMKPGRVNLDNLTVVLHKPRLAENIGAAARAACNMGLRRMIVVRPEELDEERMLKMATGPSAELIRRLQVYDDVATALGSFQYIVGTTARLGGAYRQSPLSPRELAQQLVAISQRNKVALLFGPENWGLTNEELAYCHALVTIPTSAFRSLNLAQAVLVLAYEIFLAREEDAPRFVPRLANSFELEAMYAELQETLVKINYIGHQNPELWMMRLRRFFSRHGLRAAEVQVVRGICRQIDWYVRRRLLGKG
ncbi:MAG: RNA methyltransferase [Desulfobacca sp.]|uniref:RNA methyltransferase n=1 Tax=Desulfobacca sp. TaxID=2067990 RepID=UPI0040494A5C